MLLSAAKTRETREFKKIFEGYVEELGGRKCVKIIKAIGDGATDDKIEKKTGIKMASVRSLLNVLHQHGVVDYTREKNLDNGWFTYTWKFNFDRATRNFFAAKKKEYEGLAMKMGGCPENSSDYKCRKGCARLSFEQAFENTFRCPSCKGKMKPFDNSKELKEMNSRIKTLEQILEKGYISPIA